VARVDSWRGGRLGFGGTSRFVTRWTFGDLVARVDGHAVDVWALVARMDSCFGGRFGLWWHESVRDTVDVCGFGGTSRFGVEVPSGPVFLLPFHLLCPESVGPVPEHFKDSGAKAPFVAGRDSVA
jgi:hypothetical protein